MTHSIPDGMAVALDSPHGAILHTGDQVRIAPLDGDRPICIAWPRKRAAAGYLLLSDSTNAAEAKATQSERTVGPVLQRIVRQAPNIVVASFSSHIHRVQQIVNAARADQRVVAFLGRSMETSVAAARRLGILQVDDRDVIDIAEVADLDPGRVVVICTGSQGSRSRRSRSWRSASTVGELAEGDTVVLSSSLIPATSRRSTASDALYRTGADVYHMPADLVHASACRAGGAAPDALPRPSSVVHPGARRAAAPAASRPPQPKTSVIPRDHVIVCEDGDVSLRWGRRSRSSSACRPA